jgi:hypothetical protein
MRYQLSVISRQTDNRWYIDPELETRNPRPATRGFRPSVLVRWPNDLHGVSQLE